MMENFTLGQLVCSLTKPIGVPRSRVIVVHGLGEHGGRHQDIASRLNAAGHEVIRFDFRGCGRSKGRSQYIDRFEDYLDDLHAVRGFAQTLAPKCPILLYGHSLGGGLVIHYAAKHGVGLHSLILSAPAFQTGKGISAVKIFIAKLLSRIAPKLRIQGSLDTSAISRNPAVVEAYLSDPLNASYSTVRQGAEILKWLPLLPEACRKITLPVIIMHGGADRLISPEGSRLLLEALQSPDKELLTFAGGYHELYHDLDREEFFQKVIAWMDARL